MPAPDPSDLTSPARLAAVEAVGVAGADAVLDRLARLTARVLGAPTALVSLVEAGRQVFPGCAGLAEPWATARGTPLSHSFCRHVVTTGKPLVVADARCDERVCANLAIADLGVIAYAGVPLVTPDGEVLGSLCVIDRAPRQWTPADVATLEDLAQGTAADLALRIVTRRLSDERTALTALLDHTEELACCTGADGRFTFVNREWQRALGYSMADAAGLTPLDLVAPEDAGRVRAVIRQLLAGETVREFEAVLVARDGRRLACRGWAVPQMRAGPDGTPVCDGTRMGVRDVTAEREAEAARARLAGALDASPDFAALVGAGGRLLYLNRAGRRLIGLPEHADLASVSLADLHPDDAFARVLAEAIPSVEQHGAWSGDSVLLAAAGTPVPVAVTMVGHVTTDTLGPPLVISVVARDLRERARGEVALRASEKRAREAEARFRAALDASPDAFYLLEVVRDGDGAVADFTFVEVNAAAGSLYGLSPDDLIGHTLGTVFPHAREAGSVIESFRTAVDGGTPYHGEYRTRDPRAVAGWLWLQVVPIRTGDGPVTGLAVTARDVTARKRADGEARLALTVTRALADVSDADGALAAALGAMCEASGVPYAEAWVPEARGPVFDRGTGAGLPEGDLVLVRGPAWYDRNDQRLADFAAAAAAFRFSAGEGLPGRAAASGTATWRADSSADGQSRHATLAQEAGLRSALAVPLVVDGVLVAVLAFHTGNAATFGDAERALLAAVGTQVGTAVRQRLVKAALARERAFLAATLESLSDGVVACDATGNLVLFNRASREFHGLPEVALPPDEWTAHYNLYRADGVTPLPMEEIPLQRAFRGEEVHDAEMAIAPTGQAPRLIRASGRPIHAANGDVLGAVAAMRDVTEHVRVETALREREAELRLTQDAAGMRGWTLDLATNRLTLAPGAHDVVHFGDEAVADDTAGADDATAAAGARTASVVLGGARTRASIHPEDLAQADADLAAALTASDGRYASTYRAVGPTGAWRWVRATGRVERDPSGVPRLLRGVSIDVTDEREVRRRAEAAEGELRALFAAMRDVVLVLDANGIYRRVVPTAPGLLYRPVRDMEGRRMHDVLPAAAADEFVTVVRGVLATGAPTQHDYALDRDSGRTYYTASVSPVGDGTVLWVARDVTAQKRAESALRELSTRDELTGLYNRRGFRMLAEQSRVLGRREGRRDAVLYIDLDRFKAINDTHGHAAGDEAIQAVARVLRTTVREGDLVARFGGDEFVVYAVRLAHPGEAHVLAARLKAACARFNATASDGAERPWTIDFSVGVAETEPSDDLDALLQRADAALYAEKLTRC